MNGLFYHKEIAEYTTLSLLRFYENGYVIFKKITGDKEYFAKELKKFSMTGHVVNGEPEYTFCGAFEDFGSGTISFKVENEILDPSNTWSQKDVLSFKGTINDETTLLLKQTSKRTGFEIENNYLKTTDEDLLNEL
ncbi:MAG: hypothetical protein A3D31_02715 [Candidatus Fluviicola riflensis]|nr:MAG: hypothetical protein CHH17_12325 [Candidatus Fluviicola riflensis]OGS78902.1 MAG: hypothetical protein A3D31_02715 [Candidatus Fluviicola riflensis]OGS85924.1 MAG: hypothetical protein A3E30_10200 [Fluviicola sp. RIFCSPHIGHO2_12_FULL_43_24]OGS86333.1 MAG: hypothetical protein A2724_02170 [Fluviicola sp. RIFCSPHIGHO2_01_FULL_43_53]